MARKSYLPDLQVTLDHQIARLKTYQAEQPASSQASQPLVPPSTEPPPPSLVTEPLPSPVGIPRSARRRKITLIVVVLLALLVVSGGTVLLVVSAVGRPSPIPTPPPGGLVNTPTPLPTPTATAASAPTPTSTASPVTPTPGVTATPGTTATPGVTVTPGPTPTPVIGPPPSQPGPTVPAWVAWIIGILLPLLLTFRIDAARHLILRLLRRMPKASLEPSWAPGGLLDQRISHLEQVSSWIEEDPEFARLLDSSIGKQVQASEQREKVFSALLGIGMLIAGWLLSAIAPNMLFH